MRREIEALYAGDFLRDKCVQYHKDVYIRRRAEFAFGSAAVEDNRNQIRGKAFFCFLYELREQRRDICGQTFNGCCDCWGHRLMMLSQRGDSCQLQLHGVNCDLRLSDCWKQCQSLRVAPLRNRGSHRLWVLMRTQPRGYAIDR